MQKKTVKVAFEEGLHARPASEFCKMAGKFESQIVLHKDGECFDGKSILMVLSMGAAKGEVFEITAEGADEEPALQTLAEFVEQEQRHGTERNY